MDACFRASNKNEVGNLTLVNHRFKEVITCDVDHPFEYNCKPRKIIRRLAVDVIKRKSLVKALKNLIGEICVVLGFWNADPYFKGLKLIMNKCEAKKTTGMFFITYKTDDYFDISTRVSRKIINLIKKIHDKGHSIGLHPGYRTYNNKENFKKSINGLREIFVKLDIRPKEIGSRQHYLRWNTPVTPNILEENNISYDSTLGYADIIGFRCGTCHEFPFFDVLNQKRKSVRQIPLIAMETTILNEKYMNLKHEDALDYILKNQRRLRKDWRFVCIVVAQFKS